ncbi:hypothetical protein ES319_A13G139800v1 [Gossypium barbadense]|uniref:Uncharacterized protein n=2 Tax=Gossypium TaxID=3633 RepID=A0A5J5SYZ3_GOSBA|nr:hypothetical protein ES319_A13G139800v1 [Gossypium barbadense]KAB2048872.1 hypothetical protein ES319_A13G139800v1 [Gossypium barbadense]TYG86632.1 hypothetical protein ES288_A13G149200v1 [Gossypium darwinii]
MSLAVLCKNYMMRPFLSSRFQYSMEPLKRHFILRKKPKRKMKSTKYMKSFERLKIDMKKISKEQQSIKEGQGQVEAKFNAIEQECKQLCDEIDLMIRCSANTQIRLGLMFSILKARQQADFGTAAQLTGLLREIVGRDDEYKSEESGVRTDVQGKHVVT